MRNSRKCPPLISRAIVTPPPIRNLASADSPLDICVWCTVASVVRAAAKMSRRVSLLKASFENQALASSEQRGSSCHSVGHGSGHAKLPVSASSFSFFSCMVYGASEGKGGMHAVESKLTCHSNVEGDKIQWSAHKHECAAPAAARAADVTACAACEGGSIGISACTDGAMNSTALPAATAAPQPRVCCSVPYRVAVLPEGAAAPPSSRAITLGSPYTYCSCGHSQTDPFCDSTCASAPLALLHHAHPPLAFTCTKRQTFVLLCGCKRTRDPPFCDGSHSKLTMADLAW